MTVVAVYLFTALAVLDLVLTRRRLARRTGSGRAALGARTPALHAGVGAVGVLVWVVYLVAPEASPPGDPLVGIVALLLLWVAALTGLLILARTGGASPRVVAHVAPVLGVAFLTWAYATSAV